MSASSVERAEQILAEVKPLAAEYYRLTGKPLGVTGEVAEYVAAKTLGLELAIARTPGYDAIRNTPSGPERIQIKGRAYGEKPKPGQRMSRIKTDAACDFVLLVILDNLTLDAREMWEAPFAAVKERLALGGKARERGALGVAEFKNIARRVWPESGSVEGIASVAAQGNRLCPECGHEFKGKGFVGLDAHWKARHNNVMPYEHARRLIKEGAYTRKGTPG
jgi:hypothetical protein